MAARLSLIRSHLDERAWRLLLGAEARVLGRGGITVVAAAAAVHPDTVAQGVRELDYPEPIPGRVRRPGAGRPSVARTDPGLVEALDGLVDPDSRGDPESPLRWTTKSTTKLAVELSAAGHRVSARTVAKLLKSAGYSLQANAKAVEGKQHPDRDAQFGYLNTQAAQFQAAGDPVVSVDTKKKELIGNYTAAGREWEPVGQPVRVNVHDFPNPVLGKVAPYGIYDITTNTGWVNVGTDADTGQFAVESIRRWWNDIGAAGYPHARRLLITADSGGSNGSRLRLWKTEMPPPPSRPAWRSRCVTCHRAPRNGTRSSTGCSPRSAATGADARWSPTKSSSRPSRPPPPAPAWPCTPNSTPTPTPAASRSPRRT